MRRGYMAWNQAEVPQQVLDARADAVLAGLAERGFDALLAYTDHSCPQAVASITHFVPYWSNAVLVIEPRHRTTLVATLSRRVFPWMESVSYVGERVPALDLAAGLAKRLAEAQPAPRRLAVVDMAAFPAQVLARVREALPGVELVEARDWFDAAVGAPPAVVDERARAIAQAGLQAGAQAAASGQADDVIAAVEAACRMAGAEEAYIWLAPDVDADPRLRRIEGGATLGERYALQVSVAYKGHWLRLARTLARPGAGKSAPDADAWLQQLASDLRAAPQPAAVIDKALTAWPGMRLAFWRIEAPRGAQPLAVVADSSGGQAPAPLAAGITRTLTLRMRSADGWLHLAQPI